MIEHRDQLIVNVISKISTKKSTYSDQNLPLI